MLPLGVPCWTSCSLTCAMALSTLWSRLVATNTFMQATGVYQREPSDPKLKGIAAASSDVKQYNWLSESVHVCVSVYIVL